MSFYSEELKNIPLDSKTKGERVKEKIENDLCVLESDLQKLSHKRFGQAMKHILKIARIVKKGSKELL